MEIYDPFKDILGTYVIKYKLFRMYSVVFFIIVETDKNGFSMVHLAIDMLWFRVRV